jgi:hypothetical protein
MKAQQHQVFAPHSAAQTPNNKQEATTERPASRRQITMLQSKFPWLRWVLR